MGGTATMGTAQLGSARAIGDGHLATWWPEDPQGVRQVLWGGKMLCRDPAGCPQCPPSRWFSLCSCNPAQPSPDPEKRAERGRARRICFPASP